MPVHTIREYMQAYGTSEGAEKAWDTRGRGRHTLSKMVEERYNVPRSSNWGERLPCQGSYDTDDCAQLSSALKLWTETNTGSRELSRMGEAIVKGKPDDYTVEDTPYEVLTKEDLQPKAQSIINAIRAAPARDANLWRALGRHEKAALADAHLRAGQDVELRGPKAFTWDSAVAEKFASRHTDDPTPKVFFHISGPVKAFDTRNVSHYYSKNEALTHGRFKIDKIYDAGPQRVVYQMHQTGVF